MFQEPPGPIPGPKSLEATKEIQEAHRLDRSISTSGFEGIMALRQNRFVQAETLLQRAMQDSPDSPDWAIHFANSIILNRNRLGSRAAPLKELIERFADNGLLACYYAVALAQDREFRAAARELERARSLGTDPANFLPPQVVRQIEELGAPGLFERFGKIMLYFAGFYALVMVCMAGIGLLLAGRTRGKRALRLLQDQTDYLVNDGQVIRGQGETMLARLYALALFAGLVLFYLSIPFVVLGLLGTTGLLLYLIFLGGRIPIQLVVIIAMVGLGMAWAVIKSLFTTPAPGSFGVPKTAEDCPRLHQILQEVARRVDTDPVAEVYVAPGSAIGVHQEGRGPFGIFGIKRRVLTLGLSTMRFLTVGELQAILAHEYAHFSHRDTFYSRFIYQVHLSIQQALWGMGSAGGSFNYVNPFYWFLYLYYQCYSLLSAGFSRSREFLADRMASSLYGSNVFVSALTKVSTDGTLFEMTIYGNIAKLLEQQQAFVNMYEAFHQYRDELLSREEREEQFQKLLAEKGSLFDPHPTFAERIEAVAEFASVTKEDTTPALQLFDSPEEMEKELTQFLTNYLYAMQQWQAPAGDE